MIIGPDQLTWRYIRVRVVSRSPIRSRAPRQQITNSLAGPTSRLSGGTLSEGGPPPTTAPALGRSDAASPSRVRWHPACSPPEPRGAQQTARAKSRTGWKRGCRRRRRIQAVVDPQQAFCQPFRNEGPQRNIRIQAPIRTISQRPRLSPSASSRRSRACGRPASSIPPCCRTRSTRCRAAPQTGRPWPCRAAGTPCRRRSCGGRE